MGATILWERVMSELHVFPGVERAVALANNV